MGIITNLAFDRSISETAALVILAIRLIGKYTILAFTLTLSKGAQVEKVLLLLGLIKDHVVAGLVLKCTEVIEGEVVVEEAREGEVLGLRRRLAQG